MLTADEECAFDCIASDYDATWSETAIGRAQRQAVWHQIDPLFKPGNRVLDTGCGTGVDACHLENRGIRVLGIDSSREMVRRAQARGVNAVWLRIEELRRLNSQFDGAISNFGALNCVSTLVPVAASFAQSVRSGGYLAICLLNKVCAWEIFHFLTERKPRKAFRRMRRELEASFGARVFYPSHSTVISAFHHQFRLLKTVGIGLSVPPSYINTVSDEQIERFAEFDRHFAHKPLLRSLSDHRLYIFERV